MTTFNRPSSFDSIKDELPQDQTAQIIELNQKEKTGKATLTKPRLVTKRLSDIVNTYYPELKQPVKGLITEGTTILAGASKIGKSWMALHLCMSVASGQPFLGRETQQGQVLYLALEDGERRLQARAKKIADKANIDLSEYDPYLDTLITAPTVDYGLIDMLETWITEHDNARMICIDVMQKIRGSASKGTAYQADYSYLTPFVNLAKQHHIAIVLLHHVNKRSDKDSSDPYDKISGSTGLMSAADTALLLTRPRNEKNATIKIAGREVYDDDIIVNFDDGLWSVISDQGSEYVARQAYENNDVVRLIRAILKDSPGGIDMTYVEFMQESDKRLGRYVTGSGQETAAAVRKIADELSLYDNITITNKNFGNLRGMVITQKTAAHGWSTQLTLD